MKELSGTHGKVSVDIVTSCVLVQNRGFDVDKIYKHFGSYVHC